MEVCDSSATPMATGTFRMSMAIPPVSTGTAIGWVATGTAIIVLSSSILLLFFHPPPLEVKDGFLFTPTITLTSLHYLKVIVGVYFAFSNRKAVCLFPPFLELERKNVFPQCLLPQALHIT